MKKYIFVLLVVATSFLVVLLYGQTTEAKSVSDTCQKAEIVFVRGAGSDLRGRESNRFEQQLAVNLKSTKFHYYELGTEQYNGRRYPAVDIDKNSYENGRDAYIKNKMSAIYASKYGISVLEGVVIDIDILQGYNLSNSLTRE